MNVPGWAWIGLIAFIGCLVIVNVWFVHRTNREVKTRAAALETAVWVSIGLAFGGFVAVTLGAGAASEYFSGYLLETSLSVDNVFVWALILGYFKVPLRYQHRVLFAGIFGALALRAIFIFAGLALIERFSWVLYIFGAFLVYTSITLLIDRDEEIDPSASRLMRIISRVLPVAAQEHGKKMITRVDGRLLVTPLFAVIVFVEFTDVLFAVDSVPAVLAVSREEFIVFSSNAFAILALRSLYFLVGDVQARFEHLTKGLAVILAFIGVKMLIDEWYSVATWLSLAVICAILIVSIGFSVRSDRMKKSETTEHGTSSFDRKGRSGRSGRSETDFPGSEH